MGQCRLDIGELSPVVIAQNETGGLFLDGRKWKRRAIGQSVKLIYRKRVFDECRYRGHLTLNFGG